MMSARVKRYGITALVLAAAPCLFPASSAAETMQVFVSVLPQKYFAERVGAERVSVSVMVGPGQSPATYEPTPKQMARLEDALLYFRIGVPFEEVWMDRVAEANPGMKIVDTGEQVTARPPNDPEEIDPHIWTGPLLADHIARTMKDAFAAADPDHRVEYEQNYRLLAVDLRQLDTDIRAILGPLERRSFMVFHPSWGYFADTYGLEQIAIEKHGIEPGARHLAEVIEAARSGNFRVIFVQEQFSRRNAETVAREAGAKIVVVDPLAEDYIANLRSIAALFAEAMQ
jgi:zinc transport system substrate-binding protein